MKAWSFVLFFISFNIACGIVTALVALEVLPPITGQGPYTSDQISSMFSFNNFTASNVATAVLAGGIVGLMGLIFRQGIFAIYAVLIFVLGLFLNVGQFIFYGVYSLANSLLLGTGLEVTIPAALQLVTLAFFFFFLASILSQRQDMT